METQYDAFISYRHAKIDTEAAIYVQHWLEHFHVPGPIRKSTGKNRINRIFRDREELPLTSNIGDDIKRALDNSEYLIVICSPRTEESEWVLREINEFLRTHDENHVLTVLAEGDPYEVIPERLTWKYEEDPAEDGSRSLRKVPMEPLSCDLRIGKRRASRVELPRLAAAILGCPYDSLVMRARQYRLRITAAVLSVIFLGLTAFAVYAWRSSARIQENYLRALRNQSEYLASESVQALDNGDRMTAIRLALEALPQEGTERPYCAKAEQALLSAVSAYVTDSFAAANLLPDSSYPIEDNVEAICVSDSEKWLAALDENNTIAVWDIKSGALAAKFLITEEININTTDFSFIGFTEKKQQTLLFTAGSSVFCLELPSGRLLWQNRIIPEDGFGSPSAVLLNNGEQLLVSDHAHSLLLLSAASGDILQTWSLDSLDADYDLLKNAESFRFSSKMAISPDDRYAAVRIMAETDSDAFSFLGTGYTAAVLDLRDGTFFCLPVEAESIENLGFSEDGQVIVQHLVPGAEKSQYFFGGNLIYHSENIITSWDQEKGTLLWEQKIISSQKYRYSETFPVHMKEEDGTARSAIILVYSSQAAFLDPENGEILKMVETPGAILDAAILKGTHLRLLTEDGYQVSAKLDSSDGCTTLRNMKAGIAFGHIGRGKLWFVPGNEAAGASTILQFSENVTDGNWEPLPAEDMPDYIRDHLVRDDAIALMGRRNSLSDEGNPEDLCLVISDGTADHELRAIYLPADDVSVDMKIAGLTSSGKEVVLLSKNTHTAWLAETGSGKIRSICLAEDDTGIIEDVRYRDDCFYILQSRDDKTDPEARSLHLIIQSLTGDRKELPAVKDGGWCDYYLSLGETGPVLILECSWDRTENTGIRAWLADPEKGTVPEIPVPDDLLPSDTFLNIADLIFPDSTGSAFAVCNGKTVTLIGDNGSKQRKIIESESPVSCVRFCKDGGLMTVSDDSRLRVYDAGGSLLWSLLLESSALSADEFEWTECEDGLLMILCGDYMNLVDTENRLLMATMESCLGYQAGPERFVCEEMSAGCGFRQRYTLDTLTAKGWEILGSFELTDQQKADYGLSVTE